MDQGTYITATVEAYNSKGWSEASRWNTSGAKVGKVPAMMNPPGGTRDSTGATVDLTWTAVVSPRDGGADVTSYSLMYNTY